MRTRLSFAILLLLLAGIPGLSLAQDGGTPAERSSIGDPYYPGLGNSGYDAQHYTIALEVDVATNTIVATTRMDARAESD
jgi:hypothetical protein